MHTNNYELDYHEIITQSDQNQNKGKVTPGWATSWKRWIIVDKSLDGSMTGAKGSTQTNIPGGRNIMWKNINQKNVRMFGMQEQFFLECDVGLGYGKIGLFQIISVNHRNLFSIWQAKGSLL